MTGNLEPCEVERNNHWTERDITQKKPPTQTCSEILISKKKNWTARDVCPRRHADYHCQHYHPVVSGIFNMISFFYIWKMPWEIWQVLSIFQIQKQKKMENQLQNAKLLVWLNYGFGMANSIIKNWWHRRIRLNRLSNTRWMNKFMKTVY